MYSRPLPRSRAASNTRASHVASYTSEDRRPWLQSAELATPAQPIAGAPSFHDHCRPPADRRRAHRYHIQQPKPASHRAASGPSLTEGVGARNTGVTGRHAYAMCIRITQ